MLSVLFNTKQKVRILQLFLNKPEDILTVKNVARMLKITKHTVVRVIHHFTNVGIVIKKVKKESKKKRGHRDPAFAVNKDFILYTEIRALFLKAQLLVEGDLVEKFKRLSGVALIIFTGALSGGEKGKSGGADVLVVGKINRDRLKKIMKAFEKQMNIELIYTVMTRSEYEYRKDITDRFLYGILEGRKIVVVDRMGDISL